MLLDTKDAIIGRLDAFLSKENLSGKPLGTSLHSADGTQFKHVDADYGA
jgi:hypothetical protein